MKNLEYKWYESLIPGEIFNSYLRTDSKIDELGDLILKSFSSIQKKVMDDSSLSEEERRDNLNYIKLREEYIKVLKKSRKHSFFRSSVNLPLTLGLEVFSYLAPSINFIDAYQSSDDYSKAIAQSMIFGICRFVSHKFIFNMNQKTQHAINEVKFEMDN